MFSFHDSRLLMCLILFITPKSHLTCPVMDNSPAQADLKLPGPSQPEHPQHKFFSTIRNKGGGVGDQSSCGKRLRILWDIFPRGFVGKDSEAYGIYSLVALSLQESGGQGNASLPIGLWRASPSSVASTDATDKSMPTRDGECFWTQSFPFHRGLP